MANFAQKRQFLGDKEGDKAYHLLTYCNLEFTQNALEIRKKVIYLSDRRKIADRAQAQEELWYLLTSNITAALTRTWVWYAAASRWTTPL